MSKSSARHQLAWALFLGTLFTLPVIGLGVLRLATGRDWGAGLQPSWLLLAAATLLSLPELFKFLNRNKQRWLKAIWPAAAALLLSAAGIWVAQSGEPTSSAFWRYSKQVLQLLVMLFFVLMPVYFLARGYSISKMARVIVAGALAQLVYSFFQAAHFYEPNEFMAYCEFIFTSNPAILAGSEQLYLNDNLLNIPRLRGTACEPLYLGNYLLMVLPIVWLTGWRLRVKAVLAAVVMALLIFTWSRGAWLGGMAQFGVLIGLSRVAGLRLFTPLRIKLLVGLMVLVLVGIADGRTELVLLWQRLLQSFSTLDWSNLTRLYSMQAAWRGFLLSPVVGLGWGQFGFHFASLVDPMGLQSMFSWPVVNNFPLAIMCETGLIGLASVGWICHQIWQVVKGRWLSALPLVRRKILLLSCGLVGVWVQLLTFSQYNLPHIWASMGLLIGYLLYCDQVEPKSDEQL